MADVTINYEGSSIVTMSASGTKTLLTAGKYCNDDIEVVYVSPGGGGGVVFQPMNYSITVENGKTSGNITFNSLLYSSDILLNWGGQSAISVGATKTIADCATDGTYFWIRAAGATTVSYNGSTATFTRDGNTNVMRIEIPAGFNGTIPFVLS